MFLATELYELQKRRWPRSGKVILAQFDENSVVVYQAYRPDIGDFAAEYGYFGGEFKFNRMTWIKTNFLWMMYRSGWGTKKGQEVVLAIRLNRSAFDQILESAVPSTLDPKIYNSEKEWKKRIDSSDVRLQWDPDRTPKGNPLERRAIQIGLRRKAIVRYSKEWIIGIDDISGFVSEQRKNLYEKGTCALVTPKEGVYNVIDPLISERLGITETGTEGHFIRKTTGSRNPAREGLEDRIIRRENEE
jgi:hypothetical protein